MEGAKVLERMLLVPVWVMFFFLPHVRLETEILQNLIFHN